MDYKQVIIDYTNHRGERTMRKITPDGMVQFKKTPYHTTLQWILGAWDHSKGEHRDFAMDRIHSWTATQGCNMPHLPANGARINER